MQAPLRQNLMRSVSPPNCQSFPSNAHRVGHLISGFLDIRWGGLCPCSPLGKYMRHLIQEVSLVGNEPIRHPILDHVIVITLMI